MYICLAQIHICMYIINKQPLYTSRDLNVIETLTERLAKYTEKLQKSVEERSIEVLQEKEKSELLLSKMLPRLG